MGEGMRLALKLIGIFIWKRGLFTIKNTHSLLLRLHRCILVSFSSVFVDFLAFFGSEVVENWAGTKLGHCADS